MHNTDLTRVVFHSKEDLAGGYYLEKGENILRTPTKSSYTDINDVLELYNLKKYIDNDLYLKSWTQEDIVDFKDKASEYDKVIGKFMSIIDDSNFESLYGNISRNYTHSFWELFNNQGIFKRISRTSFVNILSSKPHLIHEILTHKRIVDYYDANIKDFLLTYSRAAEILLSAYEVKDDFPRKTKFIPKGLTVQDKQKIISNYLDSGNTNLNYVSLIQNVRDRKDFKVSDKTRLKAKRLFNIEAEKILLKSSIKHGVSISFSENATKIKEGFVDENLNINCSYSVDYIKKYSDPYTLFRNFQILFEYTDAQNCINLVSKRSQMSVLEKIIGVHSQNEYKTGSIFSSSEMTSNAQIFGYDKVLNTLNISLESILQFVFTSAFQDKYDFPENARFSIPSATNSFFEKVRLLAPEFESILKQFKLFVEDGSIDFELLQISSAPSTIKDIPSLNPDKYIYFNNDNKTIVDCSYLFFSDQALLTYVEPFKEKNYHSFLELLANEQVHFNDYEEYQRLELDYLISNGVIFIDKDGIIQITNIRRLLILKDLYENEVASFYHFPVSFQIEARKMATENILLFESSLFSKPEQAYFNYILNKSEFTNGLDLRNSYLHGTQVTPEETKKHEYAYFTYLKLLFLVMLKIDDDLMISKVKRRNK